MPRVIESLDSDDLVRQYAAGKSVNELAKELGVSRSVVGRLLAAANVQLRGQSEAELVKWSRVADPLARARRVVNAHAARRGMTDSAEVQAKRAATWHRLASYDSWRERALAEAMTAAGLVPDPQHAVGPYNLDIAVKGTLVAVEVESGHWGGPRTPEQYRKRLKYVLDRGWVVLVVFTKNRELVAGLVAGRLVALAESAGRDESVRGQYGMVRGDGQNVSTRTMNLDGFARVPGF